MHSPSYVGMVIFYTTANKTLNLASGQTGQTQTISMYPTIKSIEQNNNKYLFSGEQPSIPSDVPSSGDTTPWGERGIPGGGFTVIFSIYVYFLWLLTPNQYDKSEYRITNYKLISSSKNKIVSCLPDRITQELIEPNCSAACLHSASYAALLLYPWNYSSHLAHHPILYIQQWISCTYPMSMLCRFTFFVIEYSHCPTDKGWS